jgi:Trypsin-like peptidase domain
MADPVLFRRWFESLAEKDPALHRELSARLDRRLTEESVGGGLESLAAEGADGFSAVALETIVRFVRQGRPSLTIKENRINQKDAIVEAASQEIIDRLIRATPAIEPVIPLVGRIDVSNHPRGSTFLGTGWLVDCGLVVTNRHVADLIARENGGQLVFQPGRFGEPLSVSLDYRHELGSTAQASVPVRRVVWIEPDAKKADIAFLEVGQETDGTTRAWVELAATDAEPNTHVVVVGYPARTPTCVIAEQACMDRIYGGIYDVKRIALGLMGPPSRGWATHDCTTWGGNSGSAVLDMRSGKAVALHFAGLYMVENYAVPASTIRRYLKERPWHPLAPWSEADTQMERSSVPPLPPPQSSPTDSPGDLAEIMITIPLTISISVGQPTTYEESSQQPLEPDVSQGA